MSMHYRTWTSVARLPFGDEAKWLPLTRHLDRVHPELGPVATWDDDGSSIVLIIAERQPDPTAAAESAARVISEALHATGLADRVPRVFEVEPVQDRAAYASSASC